MFEPFPLQFGLPGGPELLIILLIAVLLFGANKIPKLARSTGEAMGEFQKGREEVEQELQDIREGSTAESGTTPDATEPETTADVEAESEESPIESDPDPDPDEDEEDDLIADAETEVEESN